MGNIFNTPQSHNSSFNTKVNTNQVLKVFSVDSLLIPEAV